MRRLFISSMLLLSLLCAACTQRGSTAVADDEIDTIPLIVTKVRDCARLYISEYKVHKIITHDDQLKLKGSFLQKQFNFTIPMTERRVAIPIDATLKAYIDFADFSAEDVRCHGNKIELTLPDPHVRLTESRIDHDEIKRSVAIMRSDFSDGDLATYEQGGRAAILNSVPQLGIIDMAQASAIHALMPMLRQLGFDEDDISITFRKTFTPSDLLHLLDFSQVD